MTNSEVRQLSDDICNIINGYPEIPMEIKRIVLSNILVAVDNETKRLLEQERQLKEERSKDEQNIH